MLIMPLQIEKKPLSTNSTCQLRATKIISAGLNAGECFAIFKILFCSSLLLINGSVLPMELQRLAAVFYEKCNIACVLSK